MDFSPHRPPQRTRERIVFAGIGFATMGVSCVVAFASTLLVVYDGGARWLQWVAMTIPWMVGAYIVGLRLKSGDPRWRWLSYAVGASAFPPFFLGTALAIRGAATALRQRDFDAAAWRSDAREHDGTRGWMAASLLKNHRLEGRRLNEIDALLGSDDSSQGTGFGAGYFSDYDRVWFLGPERGLISIDSEWLVLRADSNGNVVEARIVTD